MNLLKVAGLHTVNNEQPVPVPQDLNRGWLDVYEPGVPFRKGFQPSSP